MKPASKISLLILIPILLGATLVAVNSQTYQWRPKQISKKEYETLSKIQRTSFDKNSRNRYSVTTEWHYDQDGQPVAFARILDNKNRTSRVGPKLPCGPETSICQITISPSGRYISDAVSACGESDCHSFIEIHDIKRGKVIHAQAKPEPDFWGQSDTLDLRFSQDNTKIYLASYEGLMVFSATTGKQISRLWPLKTYNSSKKRVDFDVDAMLTPNCDFFIRRDGRDISVWDIKRKKLLRPLPALPPAGHLNSHATFYQDAQLLFLTNTGSPDSKQKCNWWRCYDTFTGKNLWNAEELDISFIHQEREVYLYRENYFEIREIQSGKVLRTLPAESGLRTAEISQNGKWPLTMRTKWQAPTAYFVQKAR